VPGLVDLLAAGCDRLSGAGVVRLDKRLVKKQATPNGVARVGYSSSAR